MANDIAPKTYYFDQHCNYLQIRDGGSLFLFTSAIRRLISKHVTSKNVDAENFDIDCVDLISMQKNDTTIKTKNNTDFVCQLSSENIYDHLVMRDAIICCLFRLSKGVRSKYLDGFESLVEHMLSSTRFNAANTICVDRLIILSQHNLPNLLNVQKFTQGDYSIAMYYKSNDQMYTYQRFDTLNAFNEWLSTTK